MVREGYCFYIWKRCENVFDWFVLDEFNESEESKLRSWHFSADALIAEEMISKGNCFFLFRAPRNL